MVYLLYSQSQKSYHRDIMTRIIDANIKQLAGNAQADWIVVGMALDHKEANKLFPAIQEKLGRPIHIP